MPIHISNIGAEGYIASYVTQTTSCGDINNPWVLTVDEGQRINITLIDFTSINAKEHEENNDKCMVYATIRDTKNTVKNVVCGGGQTKITPVFMSTSNSVEIQLVYNQQQKTEQQFLLKYTSKLKFLFLFNRRFLYNQIV